MCKSKTFIRHLLHRFGNKILLDNVRFESLYKSVLQLLSIFFSLQHVCFLRIFKMHGKETKLFFFRQKSEPTFSYSYYKNS